MKFTNGLKFVIISCCLGAFVGRSIKKVLKTSSNVLMRVSFFPLSSSALLFSYEMEAQHKDTRIDEIFYQVS